MPIISTAAITMSMMALAPAVAKAIPMDPAPLIAVQRPSNRLAFIAKTLGLGEKLDTGGHLLWTKCLRGDRLAWELMEEYNRQDVILTEQVYEKLAPWSKSHPNFGLYCDDDKPRCTVCGSTNLRRKGFAYTTVGQYQRYRCNVCGKHMRSRKQAEKRNNLLTNAI